MAINIHFKRFIEYIKKFKFVAIILLIGILLMSFSGISDSRVDTGQTEKVNEVYVEKLDITLENILSKVDGAGRVEVILTVAEGEQTIYQSNISQSGNEQTADSKIDTVIVSNSARNEYGLIARIDPVKYLGAIVLCQGADSPTVRLALTEAVSKTTGLGSDRICVLKMK